MYISYPYQINGRGHSATTMRDEHIRQLIEQVLFTRPGERVNRPTFGTNLEQLVFAGISDELVTATEFMVRGALQQWLGDLIQIEAIDIQHEESTLRVTVQYLIQRNQQRNVAQFERGGLL